MLDRWLLETWLREWFAAHFPGRMEGLELVGPRGAAGVRGRLFFAGCTYDLRVQPCHAAGCRECKGDGRTAWYGLTVYDGEPTCDPFKVRVPRRVLLGRCGGLDLRDGWPESLFERCS
jgi:hypothetical protein